MDQPRTTEPPVGGSSPARAVVVDAVPKQSHIFATTSPSRSTLRATAPPWTPLEPGARGDQDLLGLRPPAARTSRRPMENASHGHAAAPTFSISKSTRPLGSTALSATHGGAPVLLPVRTFTSLSERSIALLHSNNMVCGGNAAQIYNSPYGAPSAPSAAVAVGGSRPSCNGQPLSLAEEATLVARQNSTLAAMRPQARGSHVPARTWSEKQIRPKGGAGLVIHSFVSHDNWSWIDAAATRKEQAARSLLAACAAGVKTHAKLSSRRSRHARQTDEQRPKRDTPHQPSTSAGTSPDGTRAGVPEPGQA